MMAKIFFMVGAVFILIGIVMVVAQKTPFLGKLPGDILIKKGHVTFYFPLATCIVVSIIISLVFYLIEKLKQELPETSFPARVRPFP